MAKIDIPAVPSGFATTTALNARLQQIEDEFNNKVLYRTDTGVEPNTMSDDLDMGTNKIINLEDGVQPKDAINVSQVGVIVDQAIADHDFTDDVSEAVAGLGLSLGNVVGPASSIDGELALFNGTTGRLLKRGISSSTLQASLDKVDYLTSSNDSKLEIAKQKMLNGTAVKIVCFGDSITAAIYPAELQALLRAYYKNTNITVVNAGNSGYTSTQLLAVWTSQVVSQTPDIVIPMAGRNDCIQDTGVQLYYDNMAEMYRRAAVAGYAVVACNTTPEIASLTAGTNRDFFYKQALESVAKAFNIRFVDVSKELYNLWQGVGNYTTNYLVYDGVHFTDQGYREIAGILFAKALVSGDITVKTGSKFDTNNQKLVILNNTNATRNPYLSVNFEPLRIEATVSNGGACLFIYLDSVDQCDLVIAATRENYTGKTPQLGVGNISITLTSVIETFNLGANTGSAYRVLGAPFVACALKPGLNQIYLFTTASGTCELSSFSVVKNVENYLKPIENFSGAVLPYSVNDDDNTGIRRYISSPLTIASSKVKRVFRMFNRYDLRGCVFRLRAKLNSGCVIHVGQAQSFTREWQEGFRITLTKNTTNIDVSISAVDISGTPVVVYTGSVVGDIDADNRFDFYQTPAIFRVYINSTLLVTLPYCLGLFDLAIKAGATTNCDLNAVGELDDAASLFAEIDGEEWITFGTTKKFWRRIAGANLGTTLA